MADIDTLEAALEQDDEQLKRDLPGALEGVEDDIDALLLEHAETYQELVSRVAGLDDADEFAAEEPETVERFFTIVWGGLERVSEVAPSVQEEIDTAFHVQWQPTDADVAWYAETDPDEGTISGGPGTLDDPDVTFTGETGTLFRMLGDEDFDSQQAFMRGEYQIEGQLPMAVQFGNTMEAVTENAQELDV